MTTPGTPQPYYQPDPYGQPPQWAPPSPAPAAKKSGVARWLVPVGVGVISLLIGVGIGGAGNGSAQADSNAPRTTATVTMTEQVVSTVTATPAAAAPSAAATTPAAAPAPSTSAAAPVQAPFAMPDEVGKILQAAQDDMQLVSGNPLYFTSSTDVTGAGRLQVLDSNWMVCSQSVPAGTTVTENDLVDFGVVKIGESCP